MAIIAHRGSGKSVFIRHHLLKMPSNQPGENIHFYIISATEKMNAFYKTINLPNKKIYYELFDFDTIENLTDPSFKKVIVYEDSYFRNKKVYFAKLEKLMEKAEEYNITTILSMQTIHDILKDVFEKMDYICLFGHDFKTDKKKLSSYIQDLQISDYNNFFTTHPPFTALVYDIKKHSISASRFL